jgi:hypothetical protein
VQHVTASIIVMNITYLSPVVCRQTDLENVKSAVMIQGSDGFFSPPSSNVPLYDEEEAISRIIKNEEFRGFANVEESDVRKLIWLLRSNLDTFIFGRTIEEDLVIAGYAGTNRELVANKSLTKHHFKEGCPFRGLWLCQ